jgi:MHS family metabolite:H+ symporter-like MFS transporter
MTFENAPPHKRGFYASIPQIGLAIGLCLSSGLVALLSLLPDADFLAWGWRIAFLVSVVLVAVGLYIRLRILETPEFEDLKARGERARIPFADMIRQYPRNVLLGMGARYIDGVFFNILGVFVIGYLANTLKVPRTTALLGVSLAALVMIATIPFFGRLSDRVGRRRTYAVGSIVTALSAYGAFYFMTPEADKLVLWLAIIIPFGVLYASVYGPEAALFCELFDARVRYTGISFVYQFSGIFASGITPLIATALLAQGNGKPWLICAYVVFAGVVSAVCTLAIKPAVVPPAEGGRT